MADYIDREELLDKIVNIPSEVTEKTFYDKETDLLTGSAYRQNEIIDIVNDMPTVEQKHGHWYKPQGMMPPEHHGHYECSVCHQWAMHNWKHRLELTDYCPHCGAKMDEVTE